MLYFLNVSGLQNLFLKTEVLILLVWIIKNGTQFTFKNSTLKFQKNVELSNLVEQFGFLDFKDKLMSTVCKKCQAPRNLRFIKE